MNPLLELCILFSKNNKTKFCFDFLKNIEEICHDPIQLFVLGQCYFYLCEYEKAIEIYKKCLVEKNRTDEIYKSISICHASLLEIIEAEMWLSKCSSFSNTVDEINYINQYKDQKKYLGSISGFWSDHSTHIHSLNLSKMICNLLTMDKPVHDFGCGIGFYLAELQNHGFSNLFGYEGDPDKDAVFNRILKQDLSVPFNVEKKGHVICLEVAEHIPRKYEKTFLKNIHDACEGYLIFSWAIRGQGGICHINCKNNDEVLDLLNDMGFIYQKETTMAARSVIEDYCGWFQDTLFICKKEPM